jgi:hypothetical protein
MDSRALTIETAGRASDPTDKGSLNKNSTEKERSPGTPTHESPDDSEKKSDVKNSDGGDSSPSLPVDSGISTLGSLLQSKIDPYYGLENTAATHPKMIQFLHGNAGPLTSAMLYPSLDHYDVRHEMDDDGDESEEEGAVGGSLEFSDSTTT